MHIADPSGSLRKYKYDVELDMQHVAKAPGLRGAVVVWQAVQATVINDHTSRPSWRPYQNNVKIEAMNRVALEVVRQHPNVTWLETYYGLTDTNFDFLDVSHYGKRVSRATALMLLHQACF
mmetsp:Transcript_26008/g.61336  ORF Transcript_26008/g.61336 Transcript_26008/m.61336 type:complete len:121 (-) Transcript_26008:188-550(-)